MTEQPKRSGRPGVGRALNLERVLEAGLAQLQALGPQGFGVRALARQLGITPMSVLYHVGDQHNLMRLLVERVHGEPLPEPALGLPPVQRVQVLLGHYMARVRRHPALTLCILSDPQLFGGSLAAFSEDLLEQVRQFDDEPQLLFELLVDYTHGHALALALAGEDGHGLDGAFEAGLRRLLR
ncbi:TetR/AcrR family transcriptional regulator [Pseudomonas sp. Fl5BN2]|uniref:TetR/AcrR family transcriptional regulator n=1 Tax=unclassified Pseudomonas TaxID=196821 RepID=UPI001377CA13|nr:MULTISPECIES: TetR/AcrR family transcriptional regulator [unclassified Pseudomonas]NBF04558.1 TetR/AcrR family transcriptional regulator [Pseudomonas sp. Fl5BN2]NBF11529.1 TetR/AcrR family transcriptional regulator [Pseudomonas sp. Fl4BN1]